MGPRVKVSGSVSSEGSGGGRGFYLWVTAVRGGFIEYTKQVVSKWLKICLFGLF